MPGLVHFGAWSLDVGARFAKRCMGKMNWKVAVSYKKGYSRIKVWEGMMMRPESRNTVMKGIA